MSEFGNKTLRGIDLDRLRDARSLTPWERVERNRRAAESVVLLREAGRRMRAASGGEGLEGADVEVEGGREA